MIEQLKKEFEKVYQRKGEMVFFSPGRVNLIGEHTDYNGGNVFPCALTFGTYAIVSKRTDDKINLYSLNFENTGIKTFVSGNYENKKELGWANYFQGVCWVFEENGYHLDHGLDILVYGNIPNGSGLSSSASIEVLMATIINDIWNLNIDKITLVKWCQRAENVFIGVNCGIMDQFAIGLGKKDHAILLDCATLNYTYAPLKLDGISIVIANTNKKRGLADSKYNERRSECEMALSELQSELNIKSLGELDEDTFEKHKDLIKSEVRQRRAKHAVYENQRTLKAVKALENNDIEQFGKLMIASHDSLKYDYEVTGLELDTLVAVSLKQEGVIGSRMTGAGFGGCTVSLVKDEWVEKFKENVSKEYEKVVGYAPSFYVANIGDGTYRVE